MDCNSYFHRGNCCLIYVGPEIWYRVYAKNGNKGIYYSKVGEYPRAIEMFERAKESKEFIDDLHYYLGKTYLEMGAKAKACEAWKKGLANGERRCEAMASACS